MSYLRKKLQAIMACADFKGYLREVTGYPLTLTDCMGSDLVSLSVTGNAVQDGTPSPDAPVEVQGVGERTGNLFDISGSVAISGGTIAVEGTKITFTTTDNCYGVTLAQNIQLKPNTAYTVSYRSVTFDGSYGGSYGLRVNCDGIWGSMEYGKTYCNFTTGDVGVVTINYYVGMPYQGEIGKLLVLEEPMLVEGSYTTDTMPPFEPYGYKVPVEVSGINLFDVSQIADTSVITRDGDKLILNGYACASQLSPEDFLEMTGLQPGDTMTATRDISTIKGAANSITGRITFISRSGGASCVLSNGTAPYTSVIPDDFDSEHYINANFYGAVTPDENGDLIAEMSNIMIVKGTYAADTMPPFEPYRVPQAVSVYADKPLYAVGDAGDTITLDFDAKTATRTDKTAEIKAYNNEPISGEYISSTGSLTEGAQVIYALSEPTTTDISDLQDWDAMPSTWRGTVVISADTTIQPSSMTAQYYATKKED